MNPFEFSPDLNVGRPFRRCVVLDSLQETREPNVQVCDILHTSCEVSTVEFGWPGTQGVGKLVELAIKTVVPRFLQFPPVHRRLCRKLPE